MAIEIKDLKAYENEKLLGVEEGHFVDLKSIEIQPAKLTRHLAAFANTDGGEIFIGVDENKTLSKRSWRGFGKQEDANGHLQCFEQLFPLGQDFRYEFLRTPNCQGLVLHIEILKTSDIKESSDGKVYIRRGASSIPVDTPEGLERLKMEKGLSSFENQTLETELSNVTNSYKVNEFMLDIVPNAEPDEWLKKQQMIRNGKPTVGAVLLFSDEPQAILQKRCGLKIYRYKTKEKVGTRETLAFLPVSVDGCIYDQIYAAVAKTGEIVEQVKVLGTDGLENAKYPREALHEIITNAVIHRDYSYADDIHVRIFENRIEVENPGKLPAHITTSNILSERFARNGTLVRIINKFPNPPNQDIGEGLNTAFEAMRSVRLKDPVIQQRENSVLVTLSHESLASPEELVMEYLIKNPKINNSAAREICHIGSENVMKRVFERLIDRGLIERIPELRGRSTAYKLVETPRETHPN